MPLPGQNSRPAVPRFGFYIVALITGALLLVMLLRLAWYDGRPVLIWLNSFTRYLYLPAYVCLVWSLWHRRVVLAALNVLLVAFHLATIGPDYFPAKQAAALERTATAGVSQQQTIRLLYANVCRHNRDYAAAVDAIGEAHADVVALVELDDRWVRELQATSAISSFAYHEVTTPPGGELKAVFSNVPFCAVEADRFASYHALPLDLQLQGGTVRLLTVHAPRPIGNSLKLHRYYWRKMEQLVIDQPEPLVVVGDLNATQYSRIYKRLTRDRLRGAHPDRGRGYATTWPAARYWAPPIRIDHALLSPGVECLKIDEVTIPGSDHRGLLLELRLASTGEGVPASKAGNWRPAKHR